MRAENQKSIFGLLFKTANTLQTYLDHNLKGSGITSKQMLMMIMISSCNQENPTLKDVAQLWGTSYQNIKQIALKLEQKKLIEIIDNPNDKRSKCIRLTSEANHFWKERETNDQEEMTKLFSKFTDKELAQFVSLLLKLIDSIDSDQNV